MKNDKLIKFVFVLIPLQGMYYCWSEVCNLAEETSPTLLYIYVHIIVVQNTERAMFVSRKALSQTYISYSCRSFGINYDTSTLKVFILFG